MKLTGKLAFLAFFCALTAMPAAAFAQAPGPIYRGFGYGNMSYPQFQSFNNFLNTHPQIASDLSIHPRFVNDPHYLENHPELKQYFANHPEIARAIKSDPFGFMSAQGSYGWQRGNHTGWYQGWHRNWYPSERSNFNTFLGQHPGMARELYEHPDYVHDRDWLRRHPEAQQYFNKHPGVSDEFRRNPHEWVSHESFRPGPMRAEQRRDYRREHRKERMEQRQERRQQRHEERGQRAPDNR
jgi:hypothetical protein